MYIDFWQLLYILTRNVSPSPEVSKVKIHLHFLWPVHQTPHYMYLYKPGEPHCIYSRLRIKHVSYCRERHLSIMLELKTLHLTLIKFMKNTDIKNYIPDLQWHVWFPEYSHSLSFVCWAKINCRSQLKKSCKKFCICTNMYFNVLPQVSIM